MADRNELNTALKIQASGARVRVDITWGRSAVVEPDRIYLKGDLLMCDITVNGQRISRASESWRWA